LDIPSDLKNKKYKQMKKFTVSILFFIACALSLSAQITQGKAGTIVLTCII